MNTTTCGKAITCKAAVAWGPGQPMVVEEIRVDPPQPMEVRLRIHFTSICHTDIFYWKDEGETKQIFPRIFGHEASGVIESVGEGVRDLKEGDHVIPFCNGECGDCVYCKSEKTNMCEKFPIDPRKKVMSIDGKTRFWTKDGSKPIYHFFNTSTFSEYTVVASSCVVKVDLEFPLEKMSLLGCGVSTGVGAAWNHANVKAGSSVAVFGLGTVGLAVVAGARARGASKIIGVDTNSSKIIKGKALGVTHFINPKELDTTVHEEIKKVTGGGVDYSFECSGNSSALREAFVSTHPGWGLVVLLGAQSSPAMLPIHPMELFNGVQISAALVGGFRARQIPHFAEQCMQGAVNLDEFITHELPFERFNDAVQLLMEGKSLRCLLHMRKD